CVSVRFCVLFLVAGFVFVAVVMATWTGPHHQRSRPSPEQAQDAPLTPPPPDPRPRLGHVTCGRGLRRSSDSDLRLDNKPRPDCDTDPKLERTRGSDRCHLNLVEVRVSDLQIGFQSDEVISFQFCSGSCLHARSTYDLALSRVIHLDLQFSPMRRRRRNQQQQVEKQEQAAVEEVAVRMRRRRAAGEGVNIEQPCCRPTAFEDVTFQNSEHKWQKVPDLSAKRCKCVR
ncbi:unnamed protein product, partial [Lampetra fluviatilis]